VPEEPRKLTQAEEELGLVVEHVLADCRLEYTELLKLDRAVELSFVGDMHVAAHPLGPRGDACTWRRDDDGWMLVPAVMREYPVQRNAHGGIADTRLCYSVRAPRSLTHDVSLTRSLCCDRCR